LKVVKLCSKGTSYSLVQTLLLKDVSFSHNAQHHRQMTLSRQQTFILRDRLKTIIKVP